MVKLLVIYTMKIIRILLIPVILFLGLNVPQLYAAWAIKSETIRLLQLSTTAPKEDQTSTDLEDRFDGRLSAEFWNYTTINGAGQVSNEDAWHAASMTFDDGLTIHHFPDPDFPNETADIMQKPAAGRYNNVSLFSKGGFQPTSTRDIVLKFTSSASENFYGTAGVIFQMEGTIQKNGLFARPFNMVGFAVAGKESSISGVNGPFCYLALNSMPVQVQPLDVDMGTLQSYEIRLRWINEKEWLGIIRIDDAEQCQIAMPAFGPLEIHVWSDNSLVLHRPRQWWEIAPKMDLQYQDGGEKQFQLGMIQLFEEKR